MTFKNSRFLFKPSASIIAFLLMLNSIYAFAETLAYPHVYLGEPSESKEKGKAEKMTVKYMCVGEHTGVSYSCDLQSELIGIRDSAGIDRFKINNLVSGIPSFDCPNTSGLDVENLYIYGGHLENQNSRAYTYGTSDYSLNVPDENGGRYIVKGKTRTDVATELVYETPKMAGIYTALTSLTTPEHPSPYYVWVFRDGKTVNHHLDRHVIKVGDLSRLPGCPDGSSVVDQNYLLFRNAPDINDHPEGDWAKQKTIEVATDFANLLKELTARTISYNDASYPMGGFTNKHQTHRAGNDIDLNPGYLSGYRCYNRTDKNRFVENTFKELYGKASIGPGATVFPNIDCYTMEDENPGGMHIDAVSGL